MRIGQISMKHILTLVLIALLATGCDTKKNENISTPKMNLAMKTHCIGHSLIDLPDGYALVGGALGIFTPDQNEVEEASIDLMISPHITTAGFEEKLSARHAELAAVSGDTTNKLVLVKKTEGGGTLLRTLVIDDAYKSEVHLLAHDSYVVAKISSYDNQVEKAEALALAMLSKIEPVQQLAHRRPEIFCYGGLGINGKFRSESARLRFVDKARPEVTFTVGVDTYAPTTGNTLLQRIDGPNSLLKKFDLRESVLRKGELKVAGMRAQEWLGSFKMGENRDEKELNFYMETMRSTPSPAAPEIHLEMEVKGNSALDEKGAMALWDSVLKTIR